MFHSRRLATCCKLCFELYFTTRLDRWVIIPRNQNFYRQKKTGITVSALKELRSHLSFTQLRFHCSKKQGRTFNVTTVSNGIGEAVVLQRPDGCAFLFMWVFSENGRRQLQVGHGVWELELSGKMESCFSLCGNKAGQICRIRSTQVSLASILWILVLQWPVL